MTQKTIKKVETEYIEEVDSKGVRRIHVVTKTTKWFNTSDTNHNPAISTTSEYL